MQTLENLLANAIKFSPACSMVRLESSVDGGMVQLLVFDSGRGIPEDQLESIFESFQQVDSSDTRDAGGSGLGLAIAKAIVGASGRRARSGKAQRSGWNCPWPSPVRQNVNKASSRKRPRGLKKAEQSEQKAPARGGLLF